MKRKKQSVIKVDLEQSTLDYLKAVAKLASTDVNTVVNVILAAKLIHVKE